ncbi:MAG TPA: MFS transporter [Rhodanobacteraceae bacterium]|nr:MFS transporter [Rhodanobacteraceae bacterium]
MFFFGFSSGLPFLLVGVTLSAWLKQSGIDLALIALVSYVTLTYTLKFLWAPAVDRLRLPLLGRLGQRRSWILAAQLVLAAALTGMALLTPTTSFALFIAFNGIAAFAGATQDVAIDAYRVEIAPLEAQGGLASTYTLGYRLALIVSSVGTLYIAQFAGWHVGYLVMALILAIPVVAVLRAREPENRLPRAASLGAAIREGVIGPFREFFMRFGWPLALALLVFVGLYKLPEQMVGVVAYPFYMHLGFSLTDIANVSKVYGVIVSLAGAFLGGYAVTRFGLRMPVIVSVLGIALCNLLYVLMTAHPGSIAYFALALSGDNLANGFGGTVLVAFMSGLTHRGYTATQYALLSSLANLPGKLIAGGSGYLVETVGYGGFYALSTVSVVPTLLLLAWLWPRLKPALGET